MRDIETESTNVTPTRAPAPSLLATLGKRVAGDQEGGTAIEYALIAAGVGVAVAGTVYSLGTVTAGLYQTIASLF
jgi:Flp pilus assembly pilin Flp